MTPGGWFIMIVSVGFVTGLFGWCIARVLKESRADKLHSQIDAVPPDEE